MQTQEIREARICNTNVNHDGDLVRFFLELDYGTQRRSFGGYAVDDTQRRPTDGKYGLSMLLEVAGCRNWESLVSHVVRTKIIDGQIVSLGHRDHNLWFKSMPEYEVVGMLTGGLPTAGAD